MLHLFDWRLLGMTGAIVTAGLLIPARYVKPFRSIRFNVALFSVVAILSAAGTFIPQEKFDVYHTWWFSLLLGLLAFDVIVCKLRRFPLRIFSTTHRKTQSAAEALGDLSRRSFFKQGLNSTLAVERASGQIAEWFARQNMAFKKRTEKDGFVFYGGKQRLQRWGDFILHISIVVTLSGGLIGALFGFEEPVAVLVGSSAVMKHRPYELFLHDFDIEYYESTGAPSLYASDLEVREQGRILGKKRIVVNDPLDIQRVRFYQASWGMSDEFKSVTLRILGRDLTLKRDDIVPIPGLPFSIRARKFLPSFDLDPQGRATTVDYEGRNPAVLLDFIRKNKTDASVWILKNQPELAFSDQGARLARTAPPPFFISAIEPILFSGIQVGYDPGAPLFWFGASVLLVGLCLHFYTHQRRLAIVVQPHRGGSTVMLGGWNSRHPRDFQPEFQRWVSEIETVLMGTQ